MGVKLDFKFVTYFVLTLLRKKQVGHKIQSYSLKPITQMKSIYLNRNRKFILSMDFFFHV